MKKVFPLLAVFLLLRASPQAPAWPVVFAEQYYRLYHLHLYQYPGRTAENIAYLESALRAPFANPLYALATIPDAKHWERYRYLFSMHVNLKLTELHLNWGSRYQKRTAYFFNAPWQAENLESLDRAEELFRYALRYWNEAKDWSKKAIRLRYHMQEIQFWEDENFRIETGDLDYEAIINEQLRRVEKVRADFKAMDENTY
jgi:hypothetical protein